MSMGAARVLHQVGSRERGVDVPDGEDALQTQVAEGWRWK